MKRYIQVSTDEVYGELGVDGFFTETTPLKPDGPYSASKASADLLVQSFVETYQFPLLLRDVQTIMGHISFRKS